MTQDATFYAVSDSRYFPGLVALVNSIRLTGHGHRIVIGDCGLRPEQRELLAPHCTLLDLPRDVATNPVVLKPFPYLAEPHGVAVLIDADMIVTGSLDPIIAMAAKGKLCAFPDPVSERWFAEWQELFELPASPRRQIYVCAGFVTFSTLHFPDLLERWWHCSVRVPAHRTLGRGAPNSDPLAQADQDALNALLMSEIRPEALEVLPMRLMPTWSGLARTRVVDVQTLACTLDDTPALVLHAAGTGKPWDRRRGWKRLKRDAYVVLARRLLLAPDVPIRLRPDQLPLWLQAGVGGKLALRTIDMLNRATHPARVQVIPRLRQGYRQLRASRWRAGPRPPGRRPPPPPTRRRGRPVRPRPAGCGRRRPG
jgi:hypothetical protein